MNAIRTIYLLSLLWAVALTAAAQPPPNGIPPNGIGTYYSPTPLQYGSAHITCNGLQYCQNADPLPLVGASAFCTANNEWVGASYSENFYALGCSNMYLSASAGYGQYFLWTSGTVTNPIYQYWLIHSWDLWTNCDSGGVEQDYYDVYRACTPMM